MYGFRLTNADNALTLRVRGGGQNSFASVFRGKIEATETGTRVEGHFRVNRFGLVFAATWYLLALVASSLAISESYAHGARSIASAEWIGIICVDVFLGFTGVLVVRLG